ncbi:MAG: alpha-amylase family glycosyl hydrolase [Acidimicrobiales bacterium]
MDPTDDGRPWWLDAVGYEVYLRSFADGDGDGIGDLPGLLARLDHLAWLGIDLVWITPFYPSPMADHGYDVADYTAVDPLFGTLDDFDAVVARADALGIRVLVDLVPNHSSSEHPWFAAALSSPGDPHRDWYMFHDPGPDGGPPNNWVSYFGGPAWTFDERSGQYWLHLFLPEQPDLDWRNPLVADEFDEILRFWLDRGVSGFRIDVCQGLVKDAALRDNPVIADAHPSMGPHEVFDTFEHRYDIAQTESLDVFRRWRRVTAGHDAVLLGEVYLDDPEVTARYTSSDGLHLNFSFPLVHQAWDPAGIGAVLGDLTERCPDAIVWIQGSHDERRPVSRFGGGERGRERSLALSTLVFGLPGLPLIYQGEELGLEDGHVPPADASDPIATRAGSEAESRDAARTPLPWSPGPGVGFTTGSSTWLPVSDRVPADTVAVQRDDPASHLHRVRELIALRRAEPSLRRGPVEWLARGEEGVVAYRRGRALVMANLGDEPRTVDVPPGSWRGVFATRPGAEAVAVEDQQHLLAPSAAVVLLEDDGS